MIHYVVMACGARDFIPFIHRLFPLALVFLIYGDGIHSLKNKPGRGKRIDSLLSSHLIKGFVVSFGSVEFNAVAS